MRNQQGRADARRAVLRELDRRLRDQERSARADKADREIGG